ncbi:MAG TPA: DNA-primase RepB domain-containing protein [Terriglobia bacterium]|nr:DNA-primase RepB domain-containing protein [Terriglobia bacterium]
MQPSSDINSSSRVRPGDNPALQGYKDGQGVDGPDREFVRTALQAALSEDEIERRLLLRSDFVRLSPGTDAHAYARRLIEDEKNGVQTSNIGSLGEPQAPPPPPEHDGAPPSRAQASEEAVRRYITDNFARDDWLAVFVRNSETGDVVHRVSPAQRIASSDYQRWLRYMNAHGSNVYMSLNTFRDHAQGRTKADLKEIRHLYLDIDHQGPERLAAVLSDDTVPTPNYVLNTSPGKFQVVWRVEGFGPDEAESALRALVQRFGGDPAATDSTRVFRLPGFSNKKYEQDFPVTIRSEAPPNHVYRPEDFKVPSPEHEQSAEISPSRREPVRTSGGNRSQSERDLAYAIRHLKAGDDPDEIIRAIAGYRSVDQFDKRNPARVIARKKPKPRYYAKLTVTKAMANLGITRPAQAKAPAPAEKFSGEAELEPNR